MAQVTDVDWDAVIADPRFQKLHRKKQVFLSGLMVFSIVYYFALPIGAAYFPAVFNVRVWGVLNVGLLFAISQFVVAWLIAFFYERKANSEFDSLAREIASAHLKTGG